MQARTDRRSTTGPARGDEADVASAPPRTCGVSGVWTEPGRLSLFGFVRKQQGLHGSPVKQLLSGQRLGYARDPIPIPVDQIVDGHAGW
jgi:hypothetical protein